MNQFFNLFNEQQRTGQQNNNSTNNWDNNWNYFEQPKEKKSSPSKSFDVNEFMKSNWFDQNDTRADGKQTNIADYDGSKNTSWTQTSYSPKEGFHTVSLGLKYNDKLIKTENGSYKFYDESTDDWYTVYAGSKKQIEKYGKGKAACWNSDALGSLISVQYPDGHIDKGVLLDVCSQADKEAKIDRWDVNVNPNNQEVTWWIDRFGFGDTKNPRK